MVALIERLERNTGYVIEEHILELLGLCPSCQS
jgi:Fe2+ or Zn2+ uptake regulation protein